MTSDGTPRTGHQAAYIAGLGSGLAIGTLLYTELLTMAAFFALTAVLGFVLSYKRVTEVTANA